MNQIISNHYHEVTLAWVRSYDNFYDNDKQAYKLDTATLQYEAPKAYYATATNVMTLEAEAGSSLFYSVDNGESWSLYSQPVTFDKKPEKVLYFSIYRGATSEVWEVAMERWAGSIFGNGNIWFLIAGSALIVAISVVAVEMSRKKKKAIKK